MSKLRKKTRCTRGPGAGRIAIALLAVAALTGTASAPAQGSTRSVAAGHAARARNASSCSRRSVRQTLRRVAMKRSGQRLRGRSLGRYRVCFDFNGDHRRDVALTLKRTRKHPAAWAALRGAGGDYQVASFVRQWGGRASSRSQVALRRRGRKLVASVLVWRRGDSKRCPTGGVRTRTYRWRDGRLRIAGNQRVRAKRGRCSRFGDTTSHDGGTTGAGRPSSDDAGGNDGGSDIGGNGGAGDSRPPQPDTSAPSAEPVANLRAPTLTGRAAVGQRTWCSGGLWSGNPTETNVQWSWATRSNGAWEPGEWFAQWLGYSGQSYVVRREDLGHALQCSVSARQGFGAWSKRAWSPPVVVEPLNTAAPVVRATGDGLATSPLATSTLTCDSVWDPPAPAATVTNITWQRNGEVIPGATGSTYTTTRADAGAQFRCEVAARAMTESSGGLPTGPTSAAVHVTTPPVTVTACNEHAPPYCVDPSTGQSTDEVHVEQPTQSSTRLGGGLLTTTATRDSQQPTHAHVDVTWEVDLLTPATVQLIASYCWTYAYRPCEDAQDITTMSLPAGHRVITWSSDYAGAAPMETVDVAAFDLERGAASGYTVSVFSR